MTRRRSGSRMGYSFRREGFLANPKLKLLDQCREAPRFWHYSYRTEQTCVESIERYVRFCRDLGRSGDSEGGDRWRHPRDCGEAEIQAFLSQLATDRRVSASTQNQALNALVFLYRSVIGRDLGDFGDFARAQRPARLPAVLTREECERLFTRMEPPTKWVAQVLYGSGLRLMECLRLRIKDVEHARGLVMVRSGKGDKDRVTMLPDRLIPALREQLVECRALWEADREAKLPGVWLSDALSRKYPAVAEGWAWFWFWPSRETSLDPRSGFRRRHHMIDASVQMAVKTAGRAAGIDKWVTPHILTQLCHAFTGGGHRHPDGAGFAGTRGRGDHASLHARDEEAGVGSAIAVGRNVRAQHPFSGRTNRLPADAFGVPWECKKRGEQYGLSQSVFGLAMARSRPYTL